MGECTPEDDAHLVYNLHMYVLTRIQTEPTLITEETERHSTLPSTRSCHHSSHAWRCCGVSGSLVRGTRDLSPAVSRPFPMVLDDTAGTCARISSLDAFVRSSLLVQCLDLDLRLYYAAVHNLVYACGIVPQTTAERRDTPPIHCAQEVHQSADMSIQAYSATPFKWPNCDNRCKMFVAIYRRKHSSPLWPFACDNTRLRCSQRGYTVY